MISRYTTAEMGSVWKEENKFKKWLEVEKAVCRAQSELGIIPKIAAEEQANLNFLKKRSIVWMKLLLKNQV